MKSADYQTMQTGAPRARAVAVLFLCAVGLFARASRAQTTGFDAHGRDAQGLDATLRARLEKPGDLTLRNTAISDALLTVSELWEINLVGGNEVQGSVSGVFKQTPLYEILDAILLSGGYSYRPVGQSLVVMKLEDLGDVNPLFQYDRIALRRLEAEDVAPLAERIKSPRGSVQSVPSARSIVVFDYPDRIALIRRMVEELDAAGAAGAAAGEDAGPLSVTNVRPQYVLAKNLEPAIQAVLSEAGRIGVVDAENKLVVVDHPDRLELVRSVVAQLDVPRRQVRITALIYDISLEDVERLGVNWNNAFKGRIDGDGDPQSLLSLDTLTSVPFDAGATSGVMTISRLGSNFDLTAVVNALQTARDARLLADPNVMVLDNERAIISLISEIPYQQLTQTGQGGDIGTTGFKEAGIKLNVWPQVADDDTIQMTVEPEFSRLTGFTPEDGQPIIDRRTAHTRVRVANGQTLVIGGLRQRADLGEFNGIPYLKDIKYVGKLFRGRESTVRESELVVFIRPELVTPTEPLNLRQEAALGTTNFRLDQIPIGDAYPVGGFFHGVPCDESELFSSGVPVGIDQEPAAGPPPVMVPPELQDYEPIAPGGQAGTTGRLPSSASLPSARGALASTYGILPLPSIDGGSPAASGAMIARAPAAAAPRVATLPTGEALRPPYDERFRATGGVYSNSQRLEEPAAAARRQAQDAAAQPTASPARPKSFWDKIMRF